MIIDDNSRLHLEVDSFDRDYELGDLLPLKTLGELCRDFPEIPVSIVVCLPDGATYFERGNRDPDRTAALTRLISENKPEDICTLEVPDTGGWAVFPLIYELETKGYLAIIAESEDMQGELAWGQDIVSLDKIFLHRNPYNVELVGFLF